jgi:hypothetical protein
VRQLLEWRSDPSSVLASLVPPAGTPEVVLPRGNGGADALLASTAWRAAPRLLCAPALGESDGLGAVAVAVAAARVATGRAGEVLVLGLARGRGYAIVLAAP